MVERARNCALPGVMLELKRAASAALRWGVAKR